eukprot:scaffold248334_cov99-Cyclotella_meneghiniana.AAC.1
MRQDFTPLVYSVDGMAGRETKQAERQVASLLAHKWTRSTRRWSDTFVQGWHWLLLGQTLCLCVEAVERDLNAHLSMRELPCWVGRHGGNATKHRVED